MPYQGPGIYNHHTGKVYEVLGLATNKDSEQECVVYRRLDDTGNELWFTRSLDSFNHNAFYIAHPLDPEGEVIPKFKKSVGQLSFL